jgi:serine/threonine protein kinase
MEVMDLKESKLEAEFFSNLDSSSNSPDFKYAGPFRIGRFLGKGTSGTAFVGTHVESGFKAALKAIKKSNLAKKPARWKQLRREIAVMKLMDHPNILKLYDVFETEDRIWMVTELARGGELFDYLQRGIPSRKTCLRFLAQITMGLLHCHQHGITHRDLKPENLLLDERLNIKVADFGMARFTTKGAFMNTTCGSPHYVSPEVIAGKYEGKTSDVWSLGVILYALTTGCLPFDHESIPELLKLIQAGVFTIPSDVDDDITDLIRRMMQVNVKDRILMEDIHAHPAFTGTWYFLRPPTQAETLEHFLTETLDENAFEDVIALLGSEARTEIRTKITTPEESLEKALYRLLVNRKHTRIANLHRLSPKISYRRTTQSAPASPTHFFATSPTDLPTFDLVSSPRQTKINGMGESVLVDVPLKHETKPTIISTPIQPPTVKPEILSEALTKTFDTINMFEKKIMKESSSPLRDSPISGLHFDFTSTSSTSSTSPRGKVSSTPTFTRRLSSHSKMETSNTPLSTSGRSHRSSLDSGRNGGGSSPASGGTTGGSVGRDRHGSDTKPMSLSPESLNRRIFIQVDQPLGDITPILERHSSAPSRDIKPTPNSSPFDSPVTSPRASPQSSPATSRSGSPAHTAFPAPTTQTLATPSPSSRTVSPSSPVTRPWFAAFFKRRPSMDPYKPEPSSSNVTAAVRASILHRLRAKPSQASPRRIVQMDAEQIARPSPRFSISDDSSSSSTREQHHQSLPQPQQPQQQQQSQPSQSFTISPKITARLEGLLRAAQTTSVQQPAQITIATFPRGKTPGLPVLQEEVETSKLP